MTHLVSLGGTHIAVSTSLETPRTRSIQDEQHTRYVMSRYVDLIYRQRRVAAAFDNCMVPNGFREHDPGLPKTREAAIAALQQRLAAPDFSAQVQRIDVHGELAELHLEIRAHGDVRERVDMYRVRGDRIIAHWVLH